MAAPISHKEWFVVLEYREMPVFLHLCTDLQPPISQNIIYMLLTSYFCSRRASPAYSLTAGRFGPAHELDAVRLLMSWLWDSGGDWRALTVERVAQASSSAEEKDKERVDDHEEEVMALHGLPKVKRPRR